YSILSFYFFFLTLRLPPRSTLFPYTTLFRSLFFNFTRSAMTTRSDFTHGTIDIHSTILKTLLLRHWAGMNRHLSPSHRKQKHTRRTQPRRSMSSSPRMTILRQKNLCLSG